MINTVMRVSKAMFLPNPEGSGPTDFRFNPRSPDDIFSEFFGRSNPFEGMRNGSGSRGMFGENIFASFSGGMGGGAEAANGLKKASQIEKTLVCGLGDLYKGTTKKMKISRDVIDSSGICLFRCVPLISSEEN